MYLLKEKHHSALTLGAGERAANCCWFVSISQFRFLDLSSPKNKRNSFSLIEIMNNF